MSRCPFDTVRARAADADIVCSRAKYHYDPAMRFEASETATDTEGNNLSLERFRESFKPLHERMRTFMYFC